MDKYLYYIDVLMNSRQIDEINADVLLRVLQKSISLFLKESLHAKTLIIDLLYILDRKEQSAEMLQRLFPVNNAYFDRHCKYFSEIFFSIFELSWKVEDLSVIALLKQRINEERTNYTDNILLLSHIYEDRKNLDIDLLYSVIRNLVRFKPAVPNIRFQKYIEEMIQDLMHGTMNVYIKTVKISMTITKMGIQQT